jgi:hypothetical protein
MPEMIARVPGKNLSRFPSSRDWTKIRSESAFVQGHFIDSERPGTSPRFSREGLLTLLSCCSPRTHRNHSETLITVQPSFSTMRCKTLNIFSKVCNSLPCLPSSNLPPPFSLHHPCPISVLPVTSLLLYFPTSSCQRHVTKNPSPQLLYFPHLQTVTPITLLESALTKTARSPPPNQESSLPSPCP